MDTCYKVTVKTTNAVGNNFTARDGYKECERGVFYYCGAFQDIHKFISETEILSVERMGVAYT